TNATLDGLVGKGFGEGDDGAFGRRIRQELRAWLIGLDGGGIDDRAAFSHVGKRRFAQPEHRVYVGLHGEVELIARDVLDTVAAHLIRGTVDEDVHAAEI